VSKCLLTSLLSCLSVEIIVLVSKLISSFILTAKMLDRSAIPNPMPGFRSSSKVRREHESVPENAADVSYLRNLRVNLKDFKQSEEKNNHVVKLNVSRTILMRGHDAKRSGNKCHFTPWRTIRMSSMMMIAAASVCLVYGTFSSNNSIRRRLVEHDKKAPAGSPANVGGSGQAEAPDEKNDEKSADVTGNNIRPPPNKPKKVSGPATGPNTDKSNSGTKSRKITPPSQNKRRRTTSSKSRQKRPRRITSSKSSKAAQVRFTRSKESPKCCKKMTNCIYESDEQKVVDENDNPVMDEHGNPKIEKSIKCCKLLCCGQKGLCTITEKNACCIASTSFLTGATILAGLTNIADVYVPLLKDDNKKTVPEAEEVTESTAGSASEYGTRFSLLKVDPGTLGAEQLDAQQAQQLDWQQAQEKLLAQINEIDEQMDQMDEFEGQLTQIADWVQPEMTADGELVESFFTTAGWARLDAYIGIVSMASVLLTFLLWCLGFKKWTAQRDEITVINKKVEDMSTFLASEDSKSLSSCRLNVLSNTSSGPALQVPKPDLTDVPTCISATSVIHKPAVTGIPFMGNKMMNDPLASIFTKN